MTNNCCNVCFYRDGACCSNCSECPGATTEVVGDWICDNFRHYKDVKNENKTGTC